MTHTARHGDDDDGTWAGNEDGDTDGGGGGGGGAWLSWGNLPGVPPVLRDFAEAPAGFIVGVLLNVFVDGTETVLTAVLDAALFVYEGDTVGTTEGMLGIADIPRVAATTLGGAGDAAGSTLLDGLSGLFGTIEPAVSAAGPAAPLLAAFLVAVVIVAIAYLARFAWTLIVDSINPL